VRGQIDGIGVRPRLRASAALGRLDAFVFTAGVGENAAPVHARIAERPCSLPAPA
jgi:acetate kinase